MKKVSKENLTFINKNNANLNNTVSSISQLNTDKISMGNLTETLNANNIAAQPTSSLFDIASDIISLATFGIVTKSDVLDIFYDNYLNNIYYQSDIKKIETVGTFLFVTFENGNTYTFTKKNNSIILTSISDDNGNYFSFGEEGIESLYDIIPVYDKAGDNKDIDSIMLSESGLYVELDNVTYLIDGDSKKIKQFDNDYFGATSVVGIELNYMDALCEEWSEKIRNKMSKEELKRLYGLSADNIKSMRVTDNVIQLELDNSGYLYIEEKINGDCYFRFNYKGETIFDNMTD